MANKSLTDHIAQLREIKTKITVINTTLNDLKSSQAALEQEILHALDNMGHETTSITTKAGTVSILVNNVPVVKDWNLVYKYIVKHNAFYLLQRRMSATAFREFVEMEETIPGTEVFPKRTIGLTKPKSS